MINVLHGPCLSWLSFNQRWAISQFLTETLPALKARLHRVFGIRQLRSLPAGENPFWHDSFHTGTRLGKNIMAMNTIGNVEKYDLDYLILVHLPTGQRIRIDFPKS